MSDQFLSRFFEDLGTQGKLTKKMSGYEVDVAWTTDPLAKTTSIATMESIASP